MRLPRDADPPAGRAPGLGPGGRHALEDQAVADAHGIENALAWAGRSPGSRTHLQERMDDLPRIALKIALVLFIAGSLFDLGLGLRLRDSLAGLRNPRFLGRVVLFGFVLGPLLAWALTRMLPLAQPYAVGLLLLGLTPCAPFLPVMVRRAQGDMTYAPAAMLVTAVGTVVMLPAAAPLMVTGLAVGAWTIARPLLLVVLLPLAAGMAILHMAPGLTAAIRPFVGKAAGIAAVLLLALCGLLFGRGFAETVGTFAIAAQALFFGLMTMASYRLAAGLGQRQRSVLSLAMCTRNTGAALAPLLSDVSVDERAIVMVVLAVPVQLVVALLAARLFARAARRTAQDRSWRPTGPAEAGRED
jgi:bile acid:Na+ symporter, BASS family